MAPRSIGPHTRHRAHIIYYYIRAQEIRCSCIVVYMYFFFFFTAKTFWQKNVFMIKTPSTKCMFDVYARVTRTLLLLLFLFRLEAFLTRTHAAPHITIPFWTRCARGVLCAPSTTDATYAIIIIYYNICACGGVVSGGGDEGPLSIIYARSARSRHPRPLAD